MSAFKMLGPLVLIFIASSYSVDCNVSRVNVTAGDFGCIDREGRPVINGARYAPDDDPCKSCYCSDGTSQLCTLVQCSPPVCKNWRLIQNECCQYECLDSKLGRDNDRNSSLYRYGFNNIDSANIDVRLALSGTTTLLIIALLVFMVHRLRQRRLLIIMRRMAEDQHCIEHDDSMYGTDDLTGFEFVAYKEPPPPYSSPPSTLNRHYDPPPYETAARMAEASVNGVNDSNIDNGVTGDVLDDANVIQTRM